MRSFEPTFLKALLLGTVLAAGAPPLIGCGGSSGPATIEDIRNDPTESEILEEPPDEGRSVQPEL